MPEPRPGSAGCSRRRQRSRRLHLRRSRRVKINERVEEYPQLGGGEHRRGIVHNALEVGLTCLMHGFSAVAFGLIFLLFPVELLLAFFLPPLLLFLKLLCVVRTPLRAVRALLPFRWAARRP